MTNSALNFLAPSNEEWDSPFFKVLANNDTGNSRGHQGGVVIPKELRSFFPGLSASFSAEKPTNDKRIEAELFIENEPDAIVNTRYQFQSWGGKRNPESRITDNLGSLRNKAQGGDILIIQRSIDRIDRFKITLVRQSSKEFIHVKSQTGIRKCGALLVESPPVSDTNLNVAIEDEKLLESKPFILFDDSAAVNTTTVQKIARSIAFRSNILDLYAGTCAACGEALRTPSGLIEIEAAHVIPRSKKGQDEARNGFALCRRHHWAFDKNLFGIDENRKIFVPSIVSAIPQNATLKQLHGLNIREANNADLRVHPEAFRWHFQQITK